MNHQIWKVESDRTAGPLWTGDYATWARAPRARPTSTRRRPKERIAPLAARWKDRGTGEIVIHKGEELDAHPCRGVLRRDAVPADALRDLRRHAPGPRPRAVEPWGDWQKVASAQAEAGHGGEWTFFMDLYLASTCDAQGCKADCHVTVLGLAGASVLQALAPLPLPTRASVTLISRLAALVARLRAAALTPSTAAGARVLNHGCLDADKSSAGAGDNAKN